ncbi:MAG: ABC transporter permease [Bacillati bacterium ANGP1]|uniref:ABC transporter permease n=1 Tax=Candidatus Segetimicrobium genomatis TaxID=2569760 RepID=A0A537JXY9_9BACT|nr:MAG: ABC transporter permease [Terrabacteria group bacterium ANGP1]
MPGRLIRNAAFLAGGAVVVFWIFAALEWKVITPYDPFAVGPAHPLAPPSGAHWLGTDDLGRDVLSRVLAGAAPVLTIAPTATLLSLLGGTTIGLVAGFHRGLLDDVLMRLVDAVMSLPVIIPATVVLALVGRSTTNVILAIAVLFSPLVARTVRSAVLIEREREYVDAARLRGDRGLFIMFFEILPNVTSPLIVEGTVRLGYAVFTAGTLSFLQLGIQPPSPDWGLTVAVERAFVQIAPWTVLAPALALASLIIGVNLAADGVRRALAE